MKQYLSIIAFIISLIFLNGCTENISYSGKIINYSGDFYNKLNSKKEVVDNLGQPSFIDFVEKKYYYFTEKKITKNFFDSNISERKLFVFHFNSDNTIKSINEYDLEDQIQINLIKDQTPGELIEQGLLEKIFGGVGKAPLTP